jgi:hypothetical protein
VEPDLDPIRQQSPATLRDALPQGQSFERGLVDLVEGEAALGPAQLIEPPVPSASASVAGDHAPGDDAAEPLENEPFAAPAVTSAGLTRRVRRTDNDFEGVDRFHAAPSGPSILATKRSPDDVRAMLARYRTGLHRGRAGDEPINPEPGSER